MAGASITFTVQGEAAVEQQLGALAALGQDLTPLMGGIESILIFDTEERFAQENAPDGIAWEKSQRAIEDGGKTLTDTRRLESSVTGQSTASQTEVGTNVAYGGVHQGGFNGTQQVGAHTRKITQAFGLKLKAPVEVMVPAFAREMEMPKREYLGLSDDAVTDIGDLIADLFGGTAPGLFDGGQA